MARNNTLPIHKTKPLPTHPKELDRAAGPEIAERKDILNFENSLITHNLKTRIVRLLEANYKRTGNNEPVSWRGIWIESGAQDDEFWKALNAATQDYPPAIIFVDSDHIKLNLKVRSVTIVTREVTGNTDTRNSAAVARRLFGFFVGFMNRKRRQIERQLGSMPSSA